MDYVNLGNTGLKNLSPGRTYISPQVTVDSIDIGGSRWP